MKPKNDRVPKQTQIFNLLDADDRAKVRELAMFYLKDKRDLLERSVAQAWIEATIHVLIRKGIL